MSDRPEFFDLVQSTAESPRSGEGAMLLLHDGRLFFAYTHFDGNRDDARASIVGRYSVDAGKSWGAPHVVVSKDEAKQNVMSASLLRTESDAILLFYLRKDAPDRAAMMVRRSGDESKTWGDPMCCTPAPFYYVAVNDCAEQLTCGRIVLPYEVCKEVWVKDEHIVAGCAYSDDDGTTWKHSNTIYSPKRGAMEARVVELADGRLWMLLRTDRGVIDQSFSDDRGATWSDPVSSRIESPQSPFVLKRIPATGDLLMIRNPIANLTQGTHQGYRTPLRSSISRDDGKTWTCEKDLEPDRTRTYCYLSTTFVEDTVVLSYYVGSPQQPLEALRIARVPLDWFYE